MPIHHPRYHSFMLILIQLSIFIMLSCESVPDQTKPVDAVVQKENSTVDFLRQDALTETSSEPPAGIEWLTGPYNFSLSPAPGLPPEDTDAGSRLAQPVFEWPGDAGQIYDLPDLNRQELHDLLDSMARELTMAHGYRPADTSNYTNVPPLPHDTAQEYLFVKNTDHFIRLGTCIYASRTPQIMIMSGILENNTIQINPDKNIIPTIIQNSLEAMSQANENIGIHNLDRQIIQLSYIHVDDALKMLQKLGYHTLTDGTILSSTIPFDQLPIITDIPSPKPEEIGLVGKSVETKGTFGNFAIPNEASDFTSQMISSPSNRLLVLSHPAHPEQFTQLLNLLREVIDTPARQIFVEGMVLQITSGDLEEIGIQWEYQNENFDIKIGSVSPLDSLQRTGEGSSVSSGSSEDSGSDWRVKLRALIIDGKIKVLSRPSVLTLNDRQATIRIGEEIPIATSQEGISSDSSKLSFDFEYISLGILLNIRPRISEDEKEVSMMVETVVSSRIPEKDLVIRSEDGRVLASAPTISTRKVQTYGRIANNTPFIIGGLITQDDTDLFEKVPVLGNIPLLGTLFRSKTHHAIKNEIVILLIPHILTETYQGRSIPKGEYMDTVDSELFRDSFRISYDDLFDIRFLYQNDRYEYYQNLAQSAVKRNYQLDGVEPYRSFTGDHVPGEKIITDHILYNVLKRKQTQSAIPGQNMVCITKNNQFDTHITSLFDILKTLGAGETYQSFFVHQPKKALILSFIDPTSTTDDELIKNSPIPRIGLVDCPDRTAWNKLLWELNRVTSQDYKQYSILIQNEEDIARLTLCILLKYTIIVNGGYDKMNFTDLMPGKLIEIPASSDAPYYFIDSEIAKYFLHSTAFFYTLINQEIEDKIAELKKHENQMK